MLKNETWRPVPGYEGKYEVSDRGRVRSLPRRYAGGRVLKPVGTRYLNVRLYGPGDCSYKHIKVHLLVLRVFAGPCPPGCEGRHLDGDWRNNRWAPGSEEESRAAGGNLAWGTHRENMLDKQRHGTDLNAAKTHCVNGHEFTAPNTYFSKQRGGTRRTCRRCRADREQQRRAARAA